MLVSIGAAKANLIRANALDLPIANDFVDLVVTSPPYFALRSYQDGGEHYEGQIGAEATPGEFVDALIAATREMVRVLKPSGSIFVNLGDKYQQAAGREGPMKMARERAGEFNGRSRRPDVQYVRAKSLMGIPWRYALRCIDELGLILRAEIIWAKPNGLPESVTDRVSRKHEQWFHFTVSERYYANIDTIREAVKSIPTNPMKIGTTGGKWNFNRRDGGASNFAARPLGKVPGSWWSIPTEPLRVPDTLGVDHYAAFPTAFPARFIRGWSPDGICTACGEGRRALVERTTTGHDNNPGPNVVGRQVAGNSKTDLREVMRLKASNPDRIIGMACACATPDALTAPAVVLDPFGGTGTTAAVAKALGRTGISVDLSADYLRIADWRCNGDGHAKVVAKVHGTKIAKRSQVNDSSAMRLFEDSK
jgi:DNA modification methylase